jgi:hypothetical protein
MVRISTLWNANPLGPPEAKHALCHFLISAKAPTISREKETAGAFETAPITDRVLECH